MSGALFNPVSALISDDPSRTTYRYAGLAFAMQATPTDVILIQGSATKTLRIKRVVLQGVATAAGNMPVALIKRIAAPTLGSAALTAVTAAKHDSNDAAPTGVVSTVGTANITTPGTAAGNFGAGRVQFSAAGTGVAVVPLTWDFSTRNDKPPVLRGTTEYLAINFNGAAIPAGGVLDYEIEIEEDNT